MKSFRTPRNVYGQRRRHGGHLEHDFQDDYLYNSPHPRQASFDDLIYANDGYGRAYTRYDHGFTDFHRREYDFYNEGGRYISPRFDSVEDERMQRWPEGSGSYWKYLHDPARRITGTDRRVWASQGDPFAHHRSGSNRFSRRSGNYGSDSNSGRMQRYYEEDDLVGGLNSSQPGFRPESGFLDEGRYRRHQSRRGFDSQERQFRGSAERDRYSTPDDDFRFNPEWDL